MHILLKSLGRIRDRLGKILAEYRRKNEVEIAATLYNEGKITLREAAVIMDAPVRKTLEALGERGVYLGYGMEELEEDIG
jgi:predicted HTH domain antitoxin